MKKVLPVIIAICLALFFAWYHLNYQFAAWFSGVSSSKEAILASGIDSNGCEYRIVGNDRSGAHEKLALMVKNKVGIWKTEEHDEFSDGQDLAIVQQLIARPKFLPSGGSQTAFESIIVVAGNHAVKEINIGSLLPQGVSACVHQNGEYYTIVFTSCEGRAASTPFPLSEILQSFTK